MSRKELLQRIESMAYENSFESLSLSQIAEVLGMKKASLYYYFSSKQAMQEELISNSFEEYFLKIQEIFEILNFRILLTSYFSYIESTQNIFSQIMQKGYCSDEKIKILIEEKYKISQEFIFGKLLENFGFSKEKSFIFTSLLQDFSIKKCIFGKCDIEQEKLINEIISLFK